MKVLEIDRINGQAALKRKLELPQYESYRDDEYLQLHLLKDCICEAAASRRYNGV